MWQAPERAHQLSLQGDTTSNRKDQVERLLRSLFQLCEDRCICAESDCIIRSGATRVGGDPSPDCPFTTCEVCSVFQLQQNTFYISSLQTKNERLNKLLCCAVGIGEMYRLAKPSSTLTVEQAKTRKKEVQDLMCQLVLCNKNKLNCLKNIGELAETVPRILCVQLTSGHSEFWTELRKVAKAIVKQPGLESRLAALIAIRKTIPPGNTWSQYLVSRHQKEEMDIVEKWSASLQQQDE